jgi:hypothetical protein
MELTVEAACVTLNAYSSYFCLVMDHIETQKS